jgi:hypothetical protein
MELPDASVLENDEEGNVELAQSDDSDDGNLTFPFRLLL